MSERCPHCHLAPSTGHFKCCPNWTPETHAEIVPTVSRDELVSFVQSLIEVVLDFECRCQFAKKLLGDGCVRCNPQGYAEVMVDQFIEDGRESATNA